MEIGQISKKTAELIRKAVWTVKQAHEQLVAVYQQAFTDCCGSGWEATWAEWDDFEEVVDAIEQQIKAICMNAGMPRSAWNKYKSGCRNVVFFGVPFKFRTVSIRDIQRARGLAETFEDGTEEKKVSQALKAIQDERATQWAANAAAKGGIIVLRLPREGENAEVYARQTLERIKRFLEDDRVRAMFTAQASLDSLREQVTAALEPPAKKGKVSRRKLGHTMSK